MSSKVQIVAGCRVKHSHREIRPNSNGKKRRIKEKVMGTTISVIGPHESNILFDYIGKVKNVTSNSLTGVSSLAGILLHVPNLQVSKNGSIGIIHEGI